MNCNYKMNASVLSRLTRMFGDKGIHIHIHSNNLPSVKDKTENKKDLKKIKLQKGTKRIFDPTKKESFIIKGKIPHMSLVKP